jgi:hypothetical protein
MRRNRPKRLRLQTPSGRSAHVNLCRCQSIKLPIVSFFYLDWKPNLKRFLRAQALDRFMSMQMTEINADADAAELQDANDSFHLVEKMPKEFEAETLETCLTTCHQLKYLEEYFDSCTEYRVLQQEDGPIRLAIEHDRNNLCTYICHVNEILMPSRTCGVAINKADESRKILSSIPPTLKHRRCNFQTKGETRSVISKATLIAISREKILVLMLKPRTVLYKSRTIETKFR